MNAVSVKTINAELCCCADQVLDQSAGPLLGWSSSGR